MAYRLVTLLLVLAAIFAATIIVQAVAAQSFDLPMQVPPDELSGLPAGVEFAGWPDVRMHVADPSAKQVLLHSLYSLLPLVLLVPGLVLLRGFFASVLAGDPFGEQNTRRLRAIGALLVIGAPIAELVAFALRNALFDDVAGQSASNLASEGFTVPGAALLAGLGVYILAEVFAYGTRLREDVEATI